MTDVCLCSSGGGRLFSDKVPPANTHAHTHYHTVTHTITLSHYHTHHHTPGAPVQALSDEEEDHSAPVSGVCVLPRAHDPIPSVGAGRMRL